MPSLSSSEADFFDPALLQCLACPACMGQLRLAGSKIECVGCGRLYPLIDGIPVLIADRSALPTME
jgi:uncharacterized protein YbaR (Trm112 family)